MSEQKVWDWGFEQYPWS